MSAVLPLQEEEFLSGTDFHPRTLGILSRMEFLSLLWLLGRPWLFHLFFFKTLIFYFYTLSITARKILPEFEGSLQLERKICQYWRPDHVSQEVNLWCSAMSGEAGSHLCWTRSSLGVRTVRCAAFSFPRQAQSKVPTSCAQ